MSSKSSSQGSVIGWNYSANVAVLVCAGPVCGLYQAYAGDEQIWPVPGDPTVVGEAVLDLTSRLSCLEARSAGRSYSTIQTSIGPIRFYWGFPDAAVDPDLAAIQVNGVAIGSPGYRNYCYAVGLPLQFGPSQSPPNLTFVIDFSMDEPGIISQWPWRWPYKTTWSPDAYLADIVASMLSNPIHGAGISLQAIDQTSFVAANADNDTEVSGLSPLFDSNTNLRSLLSDLLAYYNAYLYFDNGKIYILIPRPPGGSLPVIDTSMLVKEPDIQVDSYYNTWNETRVSYTDRTMQFQTLVASYDDAANMEIVGTAVQKQIDRKFISRADLAQRSAETIAQLNGIPGKTVKLVLRSLLTNLSAGAIANFPAAMQLDASTVRCAGFVPGQAISLTYAPRSIAGMVLRISKVTIGAPGDGTVTLDCATDAAITGTAAYYTPAAPSQTVFDSLNVASATVRIAGLTTTQLDGNPDGFLACVARPNGLITSYEVDANWQTTTDFTSLGSSLSFAILGSLNRWRRSDSSGRMLMDVSIASALDQAKLVDYNTNGSPLYFVAMTRLQTLRSAVDKHQLVPCWANFRVGGRFALVSSNRWELEVEPGAFGSTPFALEDFRTPVSGYWPTTLCWIGTQSDFWQYTTTSLNVFRSGGNNPSDTAFNRYFRFPTSTPQAQQDQTDATQVVFERSVTTMNANGTFVADWGARTANAEYVSLVALDGATHYWRLAEASGTTALDYFGSSIDGTYAGAFSLGVASPLTLETWDKAASFNGSSGKVTIGNATGVQVASGSLELWVKCSAPGTGRRGLAVKVGAYGIYLYDGIPGWRDWSGSVTDHNATTSVADGAWHHIVLTWLSGSSNNTKLYVDSVLVLTSITTIRDQLSSLVFACELDQAVGTAAQFYNGAIDEVALYTTQLSLARIQAHYLAGTGTW